MNTVRNDQDYANDLLMSEKHLCEAYTTAATEAATPAVRNRFKNILTSQLDVQNQVFAAMSSNGWYTPEPAQMDKIQKAKSQYSTFTS